MSVFSDMGMFGNAGKQDDEEHLKGTPDRCSFHRTGHTQIKLSRRLDRAGGGAGLTFLVDMAAMSPSSQMVTGGFKSLTGPLGNLIPHSQWKVFSYRMGSH